MLAPSSVPGETILQAALRRHQTHARLWQQCPMLYVSDSDPRGVGRVHGQRSEAEEEIAMHLQFKPMIRLACQTRVTGNTTVRRLVLDDEDEELAVPGAW